MFKEEGLLEKDEPIEERKVFNPPQMFKVEENSDESFKVFGPPNSHKTCRQNKTFGKKKKEKKAKT